VPVEVAAIVAIYWVTTFGMVAWLLNKSSESEKKA